jgi:hypothetical protein
MKNRLLIIAAFLLMICQFTDAQIKFGIRGGFNSSRINVENFQVPGFDDLEYAKGDIGYHIGVMSQIKVIGIFVQPELLFTIAKNDIRLTSSTGDEYGEEKFYKIDIPVIAGLKLGPVKFQAGPVATMMVGSKSDLLDANGIDQTFKGVTIGYQAGLGLELSSLLVDIKYEGNLSNLGDGMVVGGTTYHFDHRMNMWILSFGFLF